MIQLKIDYEHPQYQEEVGRLSAVDVESVHDFHTFEPYFIPIKNLWKDFGIQKAYERRREYQLSDSTYYFMSDLERISENDYIPNAQDILRVRNEVKLKVQLGTCESHDVIMGVYRWEMSIIFRY